MALFHKAQISIWHHFIKPKCYFGIYLQNSNIILTLVLHILNLSLMENIIIHPSKNTSLTKFIKALVYHPWQNHSFCRNNQAQGSLTTKPVGPAQFTHKFQQLEVTWANQLNFSTTKQLEPFSIKSQLVQSDQERTHVHQGLNPSSTSWNSIISHVT